MLSPEDRTVLIEKLKKCGMGKSEKRNSILDALERIAPEIKYRISQSVRETDNDAIANIADKCLEFDEGVEQLAYAISRVDGDTSSWQDLNRFVQASPLTKMAVPYAEREKLLAMVKVIEWPADKLIEYYKENIPKDWDTSNFYEAPNNLSEMLKNLANVGCQKERVPVLEFVVCLLLYAHDYGHKEIAKILEGWITYQSNILKLTSTQQKSLQEKLKAKNIPLVAKNQNASLIQAKKASYLLVRIYSDEAISKRNTSKSKIQYSIQAWLFNDTNDILTEFTEEIPTRRSIKEIELFFGKLLNQCLSDKKLLDSSNIDIDNLTIEFLVSDELLNHKFDRWQVSTARNPFELRSQYHIVVRSDERLYSPSYILYAAAWRNKFKDLQKLKEQGSELFVHICKSGECSLKDLPLNGQSACAVLFCSQEKCQDQDYLHNALRRLPIVCLALAYTPSSRRATIFPLFETLRWTGVPVALWPRKDVNTELLTSSSSYHPLSALAEKVIQWRSEAKEEQTIGKQLTLLWDDPYRLPPDLNANPYETPTLRGQEGA